MSPLPLLLTALLALLGAAPPAATNQTASVWHRALVTHEQLATAVLNESYQAGSQIVCAVLATNTPWCHLFTYEGTTCVLYDVVVDSLAAAPPQGTAMACKIRHRNVCIVDGVPLAHGETLTHECLPHTCRNGVLVPNIEAGSASCKAPFSPLALGCVYLHHETKSWCEARKHCSTLDADLAVTRASDFALLQTLMENSASDAQVWIGVKSRKWLDGRDVTRNEWADSDPNGALDDCGRMVILGGRYTVADKSCTRTFKFLCMR